MNPFYAGLGALLVLVVAIVLWRRLLHRPLPSHLQEAACPSCGWKGVVSRYAGCCPACNAKIGEQRARRRPGS